MPRSARELNFLEWLDTLPDEEHHRVVEALCAAADTLLAASVEKHPLRADDLLELDSHNLSKLFLN
jgi:hypothetical protein